MKSLYYLPLVSLFLIYSARDRGFGSDLSQWKLALAVAFLLIAGAYWLYDKTKGRK